MVLALCTAQGATELRPLFIIRLQIKGAEPALLLRFPSEYLMHNHVLMLFDILTDKTLLAHFRN